MRSIFPQSISLGTINFQLHRDKSRRGFKRRVKICRSRLIEQQQKTQLVYSGSIKQGNLCCTLFLI